MSDHKGNVHRRLNNLSIYDFACLSCPLSDLEPPLDCIWDVSHQRVMKLSQLYCPWQILYAKYDRLVPIEKREWALKRLRKKAEMPSDARECVVARDNPSRVSE